MTTINVDKKIYKKWKNHYESKISKLDYPTLKNYTEKTLLGVINNKELSKAR